MVWACAVTAVADCCTRWAWPGFPDVVMTTTLSKALGSQGGVVLGPAAVREHLVDAARPMIFDTGLTPAAVGAALAALRVLTAEPDRPNRVLRNAALLADTCGVAARPESAVVSVILGAPEVAVASGDGVPGARGARRLFPAALGAGGSVAAAADGQGVALRRRTRHRAAGVDGSAAYGTPVSYLFVTGTDTASARRSRPRHWHAAPGSPHRRGGVQARADRHDGRRRRSRRRRRLSGVDRVVGSWRYPEALAPAAAAQRTGLTLPNRVELDVFLRVVDHSHQLTLVEGRGLLVEIGDGGVTLRDLARDAHAPVLVVVRAGLGTLNHTALTLEALDAQSVCVPVW